MGPTVGWKRIRIPVGVDSQLPRDLRLAGEGRWSNTQPTMLESPGSPPSHPAPGTPPQIAAPACSGCTTSHCRSVRTQAELPFPSDPRPTPGLTFCHSDSREASDEQAATNQQLPTWPWCRSWELMPSTKRRGSSQMSWGGAERRPQCQCKIRLFPPAGWPQPPSSLHGQWVSPNQLPPVLPGRPLSFPWLKNSVRCQRLWKDLGGWTLGHHLPSARSLPCPARPPPAPAALTCPLSGSRVRTQGGTHQEGM